MEKKSTHKLFYGMLILSILGLGLSFLLMGLPQGINLMQALILGFMAAFLILLYKGHKIGWIMALIYFSWKLFTGLSLVLVFYSSLLLNADANWGGYYSFIMPLPDFIISVVALFILLRKKNRLLFFP